MEFVKLFAGLGNQLFQYSYGQYLAAQGKAVRYILRKSAGCLTEVFATAPGAVIESSSGLALALAKAYAKYLARSYRVGFFQSEEYARAARGDLSFLHAADYTRTDTYRRISTSNSVGIHVRGGDYLDATNREKFGAVCDAGYYERATRKIEELAGSARYFIFTNDASHAERTLPPRVLSRGELVADPEFRADPGYDLFLMAHCGHNIVANSTYSWWAAYLNERPGRQVVAPGKWADIPFPEGWIRV